MEFQQTLVLESAGIPAKFGALNPLEFQQILKLQFAGIPAKFGA